LAISFILALKKEYRYCFAMLALPAILGLVTLFLARFIYPEDTVHVNTKKVTAEKAFTPTFFIYIAAIALMGMGFVDFSLIGFHLKSKTLFSDEAIPLLYSLAMGIDGIAALILGKLYDRKGLSVIISVIIISGFSAPFVFFPHPYTVILGLILWGIGMGGLESIIKAALPRLMPRERIATGFGIFHGIFGIAWFLGSTIIGLLYSHYLTFAVYFSLIIQLLAIPLIYMVIKRLNREHCQWYKS